MEKRKDIDMLRFYGGDIHQKNKEGEYVITNNLVNPKNKEDMLWGDRDAYRTLNALLFEGIENEKERIYKEKRKLNPVFIELIENTLEIYRGIFAVMCRKKGNQLSVSKIKRVDRKASLMAYLKGYTESFVSCTKGEYDDEFAAKNNIILLEIESLENIPYVDYQQVVTMQEYRNYDEKEVLFPPFLSLKVSEIELTTKDNHIKDMYGKPPVGKYQLKMEEFPDYRNAITSSREELLNKILDEKDKAVLCLQDKFDARLINRVITRVRKQIIELLDEDKYIEAKVYFKPKKLSENGELEFRPLHSTDLITQIAIVSMLHLFVYEIPEEEEGDPKLRLSNLSRLIPSDFYGNRISVKPEYLFKPWKQQYQKYNQNSNDALMKYHTSLEYKYEVTLDLENFFPTINPIIIYHYVINHLPAYLNDEEREMMKRVLQKLLFCKLTTTFDEKTAKQYYKVTKGAGNYDNVDKKERNEKECWDFKENSDKFVRGIPQGLPQSYFLGNIYMISIAEIFRKKFTGVSYFYVDDSVIFTNDVREDNFKEQLKELNKQIADEANNFEEDSAIYPEETEKFYRSNLYGVNVHLDGKSNYTRLDGSK